MRLLRFAIVVLLLVQTHCFHNQLCGVGYKYDPVENIEFLRINFVVLLPEPREALSSVRTNLSLSLIAVRNKGEKDYSFVLEVFWHGSYWIGAKPKPATSLIVLALGKRFELQAESVNTDVSEESCYSLDRFCVERRRLEMLLYKIDENFIRSALLVPEPVLFRLQGEYSIATGYLVDSAKECIREFLRAVERDTVESGNIRKINKTKKRYKQKNELVPLF